MMWLRYRQQRALYDIENALEARDPRMTAMFAMFTRLTKGEETPRAERLARRPSGRWQPGLLLPLLSVGAIMAFVAGLVVAVAIGGVPACATAVHPGAWQRSVASCPARPSVSPANIVFPGLPK